MHVEATHLNVVIVTLDGHLGGACVRAEQALQCEAPNVQLDIHAASDWDSNPAALTACQDAIAQGDIIIVSMLFLDAHIQAVLPALQKRRDACDAMVCIMSGAEIVKLTRMGGLVMGGPLKGPMKYLKKLKGSSKPGKTSGARQMKMLRRLPRILKYIPGTAQDLRMYFLTLQCWLAGSEENIATLVRMLTRKYAAGPREALREQVSDIEPIVYPETGLYHPTLQGVLTTRLGDFRKQLKSSANGTANNKPTVGLLLMRSYVIAGNTQHYDAVIASLEARGFSVVPAFASGLDARPAIDAFFRKGGKTTIDCLVSLTGFSLVGGPAYNDSTAAAAELAKLDVPYLVAHPSEFQTLDQWQDNPHGLTPIEATMMVAIPELDGAISPMLYAGHQGVGEERDQDMHPVAERVDALSQRVQRLVQLRSAPRDQRKLGIMLFNFPPNAGATGTAAYLAVFESLFNVLHRLAKEGYAVDLPESVDGLRDQILKGNACDHGTDANVLATVPVDDYVRQTPWLEEIEAHWGAAPGKHLSTGQSLLVLGAKFGNVTVTVQPSFGIEGDPMRLLFEGGFAPTHAFSACYQYLRHSLNVDALLHFGTHGALEFMPGKQTGLSDQCWPERLIGDTPNFYLYAANNPSEGTIAKRRSAATLISYLTPSVTEAGLYRGLQDLKTSLQQWHAVRADAARSQEADNEARELFALLQNQAEALDITLEHEWHYAQCDRVLDALHALLNTWESTLIPHGMHVVGEAPTLEERVDLLHAFQKNAANDDQASESPDIESVRTLLKDADESRTAGTHEDWQQRLLEMNQHLQSDAELDGLVKALDGRFIEPVPGGDVLRNPDTLPTGRNLHGFDPFRLPTAHAQAAGARHADLLLDRHVADTGALPQSVAFVLWGTDNLKNEGIPIAQVLSLMGARPRVDGFGKLAGAELIPLEELGRARVDVLVTLSGIFRDLLPLQTRMLAEAAQLAARADEPLELNPIRRHALRYQQAHACDLDTAALRVFSNADGAYGANVNHLIDSGCWTDENELAETYANRKCFAYGVDGKPVKQAELLTTALGDVDLAYQNLESVELGVTSLDYYFDTLGGINSLVKQARGTPVPVYIGDQTQGAGTVRSLEEQVALETRTRMLNPKWYEGMLKHGYEGVRCIEMSVTNTLGWSATTGQVSPWVYNKLAETFVLDKAMRDRLAELNPAASVRVANRLLEAHERNYWSPSDEVLQALGEAGDELEDRLEGVAGAAA